MCITSRNEIQCCKRGYKEERGVAGKEVDCRRELRMEVVDDNICNNSISESLSISCERGEKVGKSSWNGEGRGTSTELRHSALPMTYLL